MTSRWLLRRQRKANLYSMNREFIFATALGLLTLNSLPARAASETHSDYTAPVTAISARSEATAPAKNDQVVTPSVRKDLPIASVAEDFLTTVISVSDVSKAKSGKLDESSKERLKDASSYVDIEGFSKRSLGNKRWATLPAAQREEFIQTLNQILEEVIYPLAKKISAKSDGFTYKIDAKNKNIVVVNGSVEREKLGEMIVHPFEMRLEFNAKSKKVVDAIIEKEAMSVNLKRQFDRALEKRDFSAVIDLMKKRVAKAHENKGTSSGV